MNRLLLPLFLILTLTACGSCASSNTALKAHSHAAETLDDLANDAREIVLDLRQHALDDAVTRATSGGLRGPELDAVVIQAAATFDKGPAVGAVNAFIHAKDLYVRAVLAGASKDSPSWETVKPMLADVVSAYNAMRDALGKPDNMPVLPDAINQLLGGSS